MNGGPTGSRPLVVVAGAGIAGLAAAWELVTRPTPRGAPDVVVLDPAGAVGGKLQQAEFAGRTVDLAADAFVAQRPEATTLCDELGLGDELVPVGALGASIWARGKLRPMPDGLVLGVPTRSWWPFLRSGILSPAETLRVARDLVPPHPRPEIAGGDRSVGDIIGERLGRPIVDRLVDPLLGGINAGGVDDLSAAAVFPVLIAAASQPGSLLRRLGKVRGTPSGAASRGPLFWSLRGGTASLPTVLAARLAERGVTIRTATRLEGIDRHRAEGAHGWALRIDGDRPPLVADGLVLATPAPEAARLLGAHAPVATSLLADIEEASVAVVTLSVRSETVHSRLTGTGFLVPRTSTIGGRPALVTGCTYLSRKWPALDREGDQLLRLSVGRFGDERAADLDDGELAAAAVGELATILGLEGPPEDAIVTRWDHAFPQYRVGHLLRVAAIERSVAGLGTVALAGAAYRGVGVPACIASGRTAAARVLDALADNAPAATRGAEG